VQKQKALRRQQRLGVYYPKWWLNQHMVKYMVNYIIQIMGKNKSGWVVRHHRFLFSSKWGYKLTSQINSRFAGHLSDFICDFQCEGGISGVSLVDHKVKLRVLQLLQKMC
jgi:hypothetical protein